MRSVVACLALLVLPGPAWAGRKPIAPPALTLEFRHPSGAFTFRTPEGWTLQNLPDGALESWGGELGVRFVYREGENGLDALHAACILEGLAPPAATDPRVKYEYEYVGGLLADRRVLDSAHFTRYDDAVHGHRDWRQRTVTVVGGGQSLCIMAYAPAATWKKTPLARATLEAVMSSLTFHR